MSEFSTDKKPSGPGQLLQSTRTELGFSTREISDELRLSPSQIRALEEEDYESLPGSTYVRGYLRSYARLLNLVEEEVLEAYDKSSGGDPEVEAVNLASVKRIKSGDKATKGLVAITLLVVVGLAVVWWQGRKEYDPSRFELTSDSSQENKKVEPERETSSQAEVSANVVGNVKTITAQQTPAEKNKSVAVVAKVKKPIPDSPGPKPDNISNKPPEKKVVANSATVGELKLETIVLFFDKGSWADVRDVNNKRLLYRAVSQGQVVELKGRPPFKLFIGNADGVRMEYQGSPYDLSVHITGVFARFMLGE